MTRLEMIKALAHIEASFIVPIKTTKTTVYSYYLTYYSHLNNLNELDDETLKEYYDAVIGEHKCF